MNLGKLESQTEALSSSDWFADKTKESSLSQSSAKKCHPCERTLDFLIPEQINAVFIQRLFTLNESLPTAERKSRSQLLHDVLTFVVQKWDSISQNEANLTEVLSHLSTYESASRILSKIVKQSRYGNESTHKSDRLFSFALANLDRSVLSPFVEPLLKDDSAALRKIAMSLPVERKREVCSCICSHLHSNHLNDVIASVTAPKVKKLCKTAPETPYQLYLSAFKRLDSAAFDEIQKMLKCLGLEEFLPGFKHAMIHDQVLFALSYDETDQLLGKMGLPLGVQMQIQKYISKHQKQSSACSGVSQKPAMGTIEDNEIVSNIDEMSI